ncbi:MAG: LCP family protein [Oscillospiraceae bacterium]|nr:LCP family protein [Oscillospiraceae bacterium]
MSKAFKRLILAAAAILTAAAAAAVQIVAHGPQDPSLSVSPPASSGAQSRPGGVSLPPVEADAVTVLFCGVDDAAQLTDVILLARLDLERRAADLLQIPRDAYVGEEYPTGRINAVYSGGDPSLEPMQRLIEVIRRQYRLEIDHYLVLGLSAFRELVDALGGIPMEVPGRIEFLPGKVLEAGPQTLDGERAEWFVRYRKGYASGDLGRIRAQQLFLAAAASRMRERGRAKLFSIAAQYYSQVETDLSLLDALCLANEAFEIEPGEIRAHMAPGTGVMNGSRAVYEIDGPALAALLNEYFRPGGPEIDSLDIPQVPLLPSLPEEASSQGSTQPVSPENERETQEDAPSEEAGPKQGLDWEDEPEWVWHDPPFLE